MHLLLLSLLLPPSFQNPRHVVAGGGGATSLQQPIRQPSEEQEAAQPGHIHPARRGPARGRRPRPRQAGSSRPLISHRHNSTTHDTENDNVHIGTHRKVYGDGPVLQYNHNPPPPPRLVHVTVLGPPGHLGQLNSGPPCGHKAHSCLPNAPLKQGLRGQGNDGTLLATALYPVEITVLDSPLCYRWLHHSQNIRPT